MFHEIFLKYFIEYIFFSVQHMVSISNCMIYCTVYHANCTYCELVYLIGTNIVQGFDVWNYKNCWAQPWLAFGILQVLRWSWNVSGKLFFDWYRIFFWNFEIYTMSIFWEDVFVYFFKELFRLLNCLHFCCWFCSLFSFGWWYTLMKNKHQISLYLGLNKEPTFCR